MTDPNEVPEHLLFSALLHSIDQALMPGNDYKREIRNIRSWAIYMDSRPELQKLKIRIALLSPHFDWRYELERIRSLIPIPGEKVPKLESCGYMYMDDDGNGPFWTSREEHASRYLASWPVFRKARAHQECESGMAYGVCSMCESEGLYAKEK